MQQSQHKALQDVVPNCPSASLHNISPWSLVQAQLELTPPLTTRTSRPHLKVTTSGRLRSPHGALNHTNPHPWDPPLSLPPSIKLPPITCPHMAPNQSHARIQLLTNHVPAWWIHRAQILGTRQEGAHATWVGSYNVGDCFYFIFLIIINTLNWLYI